MYDYIHGKVDLITPTAAVLEAGGVGYHLQISLQTFAQLGSLKEARLYAHYYMVRDDAPFLFGFFSREERDIFRQLITVSGVGGNTARMVLSAFTPDEVCTIIATGQAEALKTVKGLGIKTAQKIIVELRDKVGALSTENVSLPLAGGDNDTFKEALSALLMLGFVRAASEKVLRAILKEHPSATVEEVIRLSLKKL